MPPGPMSEAQKRAMQEGRLRAIAAAEGPPPPQEVATIIATIESDPGGENDPLTWRRFADEYCKDFDFGAAYRRTYPDHDLRGTAAKSAGERMAKHPIVAREIARARKGRITIEDITPNRVMLEYARIAFADIRKIVDANDDSPEGTLRALAELDEDTARAIKEVEITGTGVKIKLADKTKALDALASMLGIEGSNGNERSGNLGTLKSLESADAAEIDAMLALGNGEVVDGEIATDDELPPWADE